MTSDNFPQSGASPDQMFTSVFSVENLRERPTRIVLNADAAQAAALADLNGLVAVNALTAKAGGGQGSATPLPAVINRVTTVASANDSVLLPAAAPGLQITVTNAAATNSANVFPGTGDQINSLGANAAFALAAGKTVTFFSTVAGQWHSILSA